METRKCVATQELSTNTLDLGTRYSPAVYFVYSARGISLQPKGKSPAASRDQANFYTSIGIFSVRMRGIHARKHVHIKRYER